MMQEEFCWHRVGWTQEPLLSTRSVSELQNDASSLERCVKPELPKISDLLRVRSSLSRICLFLVTLKMLHVPITKHKACWCVRNFEPILGETNWGVCYSQHVLIYSHDSLTQLVVIGLLIIFPKQLCTGGKHQTLQSFKDVPAHLSNTLQTVIAFNTKWPKPASIKQ